MLFQCVISSTNRKRAREYAATLSSQISSPPFAKEDSNIYSSGSTIYGPWELRHEAMAAIGSIRSQYATKESTISQTINKNTLASLIGLGSGLHKHIFPSKPRLWRFADFSVVETFSLTKVKWHAHDEQIDSAYFNADKSAKPNLTIIGGLNTKKERSIMAKKLVHACGMSV